MNEPRSCARSEFFPPKWMPARQTRTEYFSQRELCCLCQCSDAGSSRPRSSRSMMTGVGIAGANIFHRTRKKSLRRRRESPQAAILTVEPLWGRDSYNNGAGMSRLLTAAAYALHNMPLGTSFDSPLLTDEQAYDVAGYIVSQKRPEKANLDKDFPIRLQKPIDTPYGPYADGFSTEQHRLGPFGPIRAKVRELAAVSRTANAGGPDNGSYESEGAK